jgi:hypothetical protein
VVPKSSGVPALIAANRKLMIICSPCLSEYKTVTGKEVKA